MYSGAGPRKAGPINLGMTVDEAGDHPGLGLIKAGPKKFRG